MKKTLSTSLIGAVALISLSSESAELKKLEWNDSIIKTLRSVNIKNVNSSGKFTIQESLITNIVEPVNKQGYSINILELNQSGELIVELVKGALSSKEVIIVAQNRLEVEEGETLGMLANRCPPK